MKHNVKLTTSLCLAMLAASGAAFAQSSGPVAPQYQIGGEAPPEDGPKGMQVSEGIYMFPYAKFGLGRDDNLFLSNTQEKSSGISLFNAGVGFDARRPSQKYSFLWDATFVDYDSSKADNYQDHTLAANGDFTLGASMGLRLGLGYDRGHDPRGSTDRGIAGRPDRFRTTSGNALFAYGANEARGRFEIELGTADKRYLNNRASTIAADRDTTNFRGTFFVRVAPKTSALVEIRQADFDYSLGTSTLDSKETRYFAGVTWEATALTSGTIKAGRLKKEFDFGGLTDFSGSSWEASVQWKPLTYSTFDFFTTKSISEATGIGDFVLTKRSGLLWQHKWNSRITTTSTYTYVQDDFTGGGATRKDETDLFSLGVAYKVARSITLGADFNVSDRDSNQPAFRYKRNQVMFTLGAAL